MSRKFIVILIDGMADYPLSKLDGKTVLEAANTPTIDRLARTSEMGIVNTIPEGFPPGSDVANLCVLGYAPEDYYTGRSPFEALSMGLELNPEDVTLRCNLVTLSEDQGYSNKIMNDYSAGEISTEEAKVLIEECQSKLGNNEFAFYPGVSYRHVVIWHGGNSDIILTPPHDISDKSISGYIPKGNDSEKLYNMMKKSIEILADHPVNCKRQEQGLHPANSIWFWGEGTKPELPHFKEKYGLSGSVISAVDLVKGLGVAAGLEPVNVAGATGRIDTNFSGKAQRAIKCLKYGDDFVYLHIEAADEAGHHGNIEEKIKSVELVDEKVLKFIMNNITDFKEYAIMILPDHYTPISIKTHSEEPVPFMIYRNYSEYGNNSARKQPGFSEKTVQKSNLFFDKGYMLMDHFLNS